MSNGGDDDDGTANEPLTVALAAARPGSDEVTRTAPIARAGGASAPLVPGDRYVLGAQLARGGMGEVLSAHDQQIGRDVAIKRLRPDVPASVGIPRFLREARIQGRLEHPAIVPVHELAYDANGQPFFVMKKLSGTTLSQILREPSRHPQFTRQRLLRAFADVCLAIEFAHTRGVIHRDLKPSNVMLGDFGEVYVIDWGVARVMREGELVVDASPTPVEPGVTVAGAAVGTPGYMAPEQVRAEADLDGRVDVYALGCVLFELLAGTPLHPRGLEGMRSALAVVDARPSVHGGVDVPPELDSLCVRATAAERDQRIATARELGEAVQRFLDGDRDLELRHRLAREHLATASAALARSDGEDARRIAMREAGRALALDPRLTPAAELVGQLMLQPPPVTPSAVALELEALDAQQARTMSLAGVVAHCVFLGLAGGFAALGITDAHYVGGLALLSVVNLLLAWVNLRRTRRVPMAALVIGNLLTVALLARAFTPFFLAPGIGAVTLTAFALHPDAANTRTMVWTGLASILVVLGVWILEALGVTPMTMYTEGGRIHLASPVDHIARLPIEASLCFYVIALFAASAVIAHATARTARTARHRLHVQAWQLRQLLAVPSDPR